MTAIRNSLLILAAGLTCLAVPATAQRQPPPPPESARAGAPVDLTGQWVAVVTEDWRWRMVTPPKGDVASIPLSPSGEAAANNWSLAADNAAGLQCKAYGVGGLLRIPTRLRISWQDANTLKLETDAGEQTRLFNFVTTTVGNVVPELDEFGPAPAERNWQGQTRAQWFKYPQSRGLGFGGGIGEGGSLHAVTQNMRAGYLRKNGVPYSENAIITEHFTVFEHAPGQTWLVITTIVDDPVNLQQPFVTSTNFKKEANRTGWSPGPCHTDPPLIAEPVVVE